MGREGKGGRGRDGGMGREGRVNSGMYIKVEKERSR